MSLVPPPREPVQYPKSGAHSEQATAARDCVQTPAGTQALTQVDSDPSQPLDSTDKVIAAPRDPAYTSARPRRRVARSGEVARASVTTVS
jgi:hypothetical protein